MTKLTQYSEWQSDQLESEKNSILFWGKKAQELLHWFTPFWKSGDGLGGTLKESDVWQGDFSKGESHWFQEGQLNASYNCLDLHLEKGLGNKVAYYFQAEDPHFNRSITYKELHTLVMEYAAVFLKLGIKQGDVVMIYMPLTIEATAQMLALSRIGAVHSVVFAGFSPRALRDRIDDCEAKLILTAFHFYRAGKKIETLAMVREAVDLDESLQNKIPVVVFNTHQSPLENPHPLPNPLRTGEMGIWEHLEGVKGTFVPATPLRAETPLFILYTSGSTGKPKGLVHSTGGYLTQVAYTFKTVFGCELENVFWCTADIGWITGHSYGVYGPLWAGATSVLFEGAFSVPDWGRIWDIVDQYQVTQLYTAPTLIRSLMAQGDQLVRSRQLSSLRLLGSVGEPINPAAWDWYHQVVGQGRCPIVDTWWQTETGAIMMTPLPFQFSPSSPLPTPKGGMAHGPLSGIFPEILDLTNHSPVKGAGSGALVVRAPWPSMALTIHKDHPRFLATYFSTYPGYYFTGDGAVRDPEGRVQITGRIDDVLNVSGHRIGTAEIESALIKHPVVAEAAVVGVEDDITGQSILCFCRLREGEEDKSTLEDQLKEVVMENIGRFARPKRIMIVEDLPKTRSGKIMRRILRLIGEGRITNLEQLTGIQDLSTLNQPEVVEKILAKFLKFNKV